MHNVRLAPVQELNTYSLTNIIAIHNNVLLCDILHASRFSNKLRKLLLYFSAKLINAAPALSQNSNRTRLTLS